MTEEIKPKKVGVGTGVMLKKENKILLGKRVSTGLWTMPGGKLEVGESFEDCIRRETLEETNLTIREMKLMSLNNDIFDHEVHYVTIGFYSEHFEGEARAMEPEKISEWHWFDLNNLPENLFLSSKKMIENYLQQKFYIEQ